jgi:hypothetical protein
MRGRGSSAQVSVPYNSNAQPAWTARLAQSPMSSSTGWVSASGTWTAGGAYGVEQTTASGDNWFYWNTQLDTFRAIQTKLRMTSYGTAIGVGFKDAAAWGATSLGIGIRCDAGGNGSLWYDRYGSGGTTLTLPGTSWALNTDYVLKVYQVPTTGDWTIYVDDVERWSLTLGTVDLGIAGLFTRAAQGWFRDVTIWEATVDMIPRTI